MLSGVSLMSAKASDRFAHLRLLSEKLGKQQQKLMITFDSHEWVVNQIRSMRKMVDCSDCTMDCVRERLDDLIVVLETQQEVEPEETEEEEE